MATDSHTTPSDPLPAMQDNPNPFSVNADEQAEDGGDYCRICRGEGTEEQPLFYPCKCSGSIRFVHQDCLMEWLSHSKKKYCELCKTPFRFTKLYDKSMPATLPLPLFVRQLVLHGLQTLVRWSRYMLVIVVWFACLPWCIRQVWRGLFWLADGSWLSETQHRNSTLRQLNATLADLQRMNASIAEHGIENVNRTLLEGILNSTLTYEQQKPLSVTSVLNSFLRLLTGETLVSKVLRFLFSMPPIQISSPTKSNVIRSLVGRRPAQRPASLLSNMAFGRNMTSSVAINNLSIDVAEGVLICLGLVAGFILVFLIREWVINQQPMLNIPDPEVADNQPGAHAAAGAEGRPILRPRRRRHLPRGVDQVGLPPLPVDQAMLRQGPGTPPRRAFTDDNIAVPVAHEHDRPELPARAASLVPNESGLAEDVLDFDEGHLSPPPLLRGALGEVVNVHRNIEEGAVEEDKLEGTAPTWVHPDTAASRPFDPDGCDPTVSDVYASPSAETKHETVQDRAVSSVEHAEETHASSDSDDPPVPTPESEDEGMASNISEAEELTHDPRVEVEGDRELASDNDDIGPTLPEQASIFDKAANWLWYVDGPIAPLPHDAGHDDFQIVENLHAEAPFVPVHNGAVVPPLVQQPVEEQPEAHLAELPAQHPQDHAPIQIEWNDQIAAEDAEDLEGILELVGMEGPLVGMVQNVIFSLFLITLTLTASIWIPYVWGKLALIFLAHPMAVAVKGPFMLVSTIADVIADIGLFVLGLFGLLFNNVTKLVKVVTKPVFPLFSNFLDTDLFEELALNATKHSGNRLENAITGAAGALTLNSDLPTFSTESHRALLVFKTSVAQTYSNALSTAGAVCASFTKFDWTLREQQKWADAIVAAFAQVPALALKTYHGLTWENVQAPFKASTHPSSHESALPMDTASAIWSTQDKIIAIVLGYAFFALAAFVFMKASRFFHGLRKEEKVPGPLADSLRQAGGVLKVVVIIGIEMLIFPLYCGLLLDLALLPLFEGATVWTRLAFIRRNPFTGLFLHWFIGTCYMFHFALFVSMCRKILRKGVLYFIRDPDDPTFHPVRDVLERPVPTQLGKIAFSALVYGGLVIMCLGGVVWSVGSIDGILPIRWSTPEPRLAFPVDVVFYNFMLPFVIRKFEPSKKLAAVYEWWFRGCAHGLRLSHFLFGEERDEEKKSDTGRLPWIKDGVLYNGSYVRAPGSDSCRIPRGQKVFLDVDEENQRLDGKPEQDKGLHGKADDKWMKIYLPPKYKARLATFVVLLWIFAAGTGVTLTIGPLVVGRILVRGASGSPGPVNDLYALTAGLHILGFAAYLATHGRDIRQWVKDKLQQYLPKPKEALPHIWSATTYGAGLLYLFVAFGIVFPLTLSLITELYIHIPIFTFLLQTDSKLRETDVSTTTDIPNLLRTPTVFVLQTWTLGLLYTRLALRIALNYPSPDSRVATAIRAITRNGWNDPDVKQATRAIILPLSASCIVLLAVPLGYAKLLIAIMRVDHKEEQMRLYRFAYPGLMGIVFGAHSFMSLKKRMDVWRARIRDEVYLVGERLHNYVEKEKSRKGKEKEKAADAGRVSIDGLTQQ